jgi:hypothetical protein
MTKRLTECDMLEMLRAACAEAGTQRAWANAHNLAPSFVNDVLKGKRGVTDRILDALGYEFIGYYRKKH